MIDVVTTLLMREGKLLLLKRGKLVSTYKEKWAGISGYLEGFEDAYERALIEIREETGLEKKDIILLKKVEPLKFFDETENVEWKIHLFLFETKKENISIDWEHTEYRWVTLEEICQYDTVPRLQEAIDKLMKS